MFTEALGVGEERRKRGMNSRENLHDTQKHYFSDASRYIYDIKSRNIPADSKEFEIIYKLIMDEILKKGVSVLSFDVFDTILTRNDKPEAHRFLEMSDLCLRMLADKYAENTDIQNLSKEDMCEARVMGMRATYRTRPLVQGCGEGMIDEIYAMQRHLLGLPQGAEKVLLEAEVVYEAQNLEMNRVLERVAMDFKKDGGQVILVSDMYLPANVIEDIIRRKSSSNFYDRIFSSADLVISKRSGKIFSYIEEEIGVSGEKILHMGDSWTGDVMRPREAGWQALYFPVSREELKMRMQNLRRFIARMDEQGMETRSWAKL